MEAVINLIINGITDSWEILENFEFLGTNMLTFSITILIITAMLPILLTLLKTERVERVGREIRERRENSDK